MALTPQQEQQVIQILNRYSAVLDMADASTEILAALGYGDTRVIDLPNASPLNANDVFYVAQTDTDVKATMQQFAQFAFDTFIAPALAAALAQQQANIDAALQTNQRYFIGQA